MDILNIDEQIHNWEQAILNKEFAEADKLRDLLDAHHVFCFTSHEGPLIFHRQSGTREDMVKEIQQDSRANRIFDAWLYTIKAKHKEHFI